MAFELTPLVVTPVIFSDIAILADRVVGILIMGFFILNGTFEVPTTLEVFTGLINVAEVFDANNVFELIPCAVKEFAPV